MSAQEIKSDQYRVAMLPVGDEVLTEQRRRLHRQRPEIVAAAADIYAAADLT